LFTSKGANNFAGLKHETHYESECVAVFYLLKKKRGKACGAIAPHRPNMGPPLVSLRFRVIELL